MGGNCDSHPVLVEVHGQNRLVKRLFPVQGRGDLGRFAKVARQLETHFGAKSRTNENFYSLSQFYYTRECSRVPILGMQTNGNDFSLMDDDSQIEKNGW